VMFYPLMCPVCDKALQRHIQNVTFTTHFPKVPWKQTVIAHCDIDHPSEPIWNILPKLDLLPKSAQVAGRGHPNTIGTVERCIHHCLKVAAFLIPLPNPSSVVDGQQADGSMKSCMALSVMYGQQAKDFMGARIAFAQSVVENTTNVISKWVPPETPSVIAAAVMGADTDNWMQESCAVAKADYHDWMRSSTMEYLRFLQEIVRCNTRPAQACSTDRLRNRFQLFFLLSGYHRNGTIIDPNDLPPMPQVEDWRDAILDGCRIIGPIRGKGETKAREKGGTNASGLCDIRNQALNRNC
jgi:hypothetical protein